MYRRILVGFDGTEGGRDALALAGNLARIEGAELLLAASLDLDPLATPATAYERAMAEAEDRLGASAREVLGDREYLLRVIGGVSAPRALTEIAEGENADVIVLGSTHRGGLGRVLPGSVGERLLHGAPCAVLVAPRGYAADGANVRIERIGVGDDGGAEASHAVRVAEALAADLGATLERIGVVENDDDPAEVLAARGGELDLLVVGSRGYGPIRHALLGGVSSEVMRRSPCPVLVVPRSVSR